MLMNISKALEAKPGDQGRTALEELVKEFGPQGRIEDEAFKRSDARRTGQLIIDQNKK